MSFEQEQLMRRLKLGGEFATYYAELDTDKDYIISQTDKDYIISQIKNLLHNGSILVEFKKADGSTRVMNCTLSDLHGAKYTQTPIVENAATEPKKKKPNDEVCAVWDIDAGAWRSFRWDRLIRIDFKLG